MSGPTNLPIAASTNCCAGKVSALRQIVLDTETTGLDPGQGHRIIEIGATEILNRRLTGRVFHRYLNPDREIDEGAAAVHGIRTEDLKGEPRFAEVSGELLDFIADAELVIHNAAFDVGFLDNELALMKHPEPKIRTHCKVLDTLGLARQMHPGQRNSLDALCRRYEVDNSKRDLHGALLDARLLAEVYLAMTGGQALLVLDAADNQREANGSAERQRQISRAGLDLVVMKASAEALEQHERVLRTIDENSGGKTVWRHEMADPAKN